MTKINFTKQHQARMEELAILLLLAGTVIKGVMGTKINVFQLLHETTISSLQTILSNLRREIDKIKTLDRWSLTNYQEQKMVDLEVQYEFVDLLIGYKKRQAEIENDRVKIRDLKNEYAQLVKSTMTPEAQLAALKKSIEALGDSVEDEGIHDQEVAAMESSQETPTV